MKILIYDVAASSGGALTILEQVYNECKLHKEHQFSFILSTPHLNELSNIVCSNFEWIKNSWLHRLFFENFVLNRIVKKINPDMIISLQNDVVFGFTCKQIMYLHQPLPFVSIRFSFLKQPKFWIYQNIISKRIIKSIKCADLVIVQTKWMKDAVLKLESDNKKIVVLPPNINKDRECSNEFGISKQPSFIYPASPLLYKDHLTICKACDILKSYNLNYSVYFTIDEKTNKYSKKIANYCKRKSLPIKFIGEKERAFIFNCYQHMTLIFPSYIETFGLPLLEARNENCMILASKTDFALEILKDYSNVKFFAIKDEKGLASLMKQVISGELVKSPNDNKIQIENKNIIDTIFEYIL